MNSGEKVASFFEKVIDSKAHTEPLNIEKVQEAEPVAESVLKVKSIQAEEIVPADNAPGFLKKKELRLVIFGGKGGTGKTTSSCATAMYLARKYPEKRFLVASSDPAHSVGDSLDSPVDSSITPVKGTDNLFAIEMDTEVLLEQFKKKYKASLDNFSAMSFSTDQIDIRDFLSFKLPGMQEMMILLEIVNLLKFGIFRPYEYDLVVWDTAPTGHTLRLLKLPDKVLKWIEIFETSLLRYKRVSIGSAMIGFKIPGRAPPKGNVRTFLDTLANDLEKIRMILKSDEKCEFVPVTIAEELSIAETDRLIATLREEEIPVHNIIVNRLQKEKDCPFCSNRSKGQEPYLKEMHEKFASFNLLRLPVFANEIRGKEGLLKFGDLLSGNNGQYSGPESALGAITVKDNLNAPENKSQEGLPGFPQGMLSGILDKDLGFIIFGGKGGVGKTTVSAATAVAVAGHNPDKKILVFSTDPAHSLADSFAVPIGDRVTPIGTGGNLYALEINGNELYQKFRKEYKANIQDAFKKWQNSYLAGGRKWKLDFDEKVMVEFVDTYPPGMEEVLALERIMGFIKNGDFDIYIFDTAPTGHLIELLKFPELVREWLRVTYRAILRYHREVPVDNIEVTAKKILASQETVQKMQALLTNRQKSEFIAVTIPEAMGMLETEDLLISMRELDIPCNHIVVNMVIPPANCDFCGTKRNGQIHYIRQIDEKTEYKGYEIALVPLYPHELRGIENLTELSRFMYGTQINADRNTDECG